MAEWVRAGLFEQRARCLSRLGYAFFSTYFSRRFCPYDAPSYPDSDGGIRTCRLNGMWPSNLLTSHQPTSLHDRSDEV
jgi:hypothetical protein